MDEGGFGTKADDIAVVLEEAIVSGEIAPGTVLRQEQLSERYQVSRTPVREALRRLAALGLVSFEPNRGVRVRTLSRDELREAFLVRAELESLATEHAVPRMGERELAELDAAATQFAQLTAELRDRNRGEDERMRVTSEWMHANHAFHDVIYASSGLPLVTRLAKSARRSFFGPATWRPGGPEVDDRYEQNLREHQAIRDAIAAGSAAGARALAREHVLSSGRLLELILEHMTGQPRTADRYATGA
ncbi:MAG TPA: GntR family transcriptional regulator [Gaiellaceae bacterium]